MNVLEGERPAEGPAARRADGPALWCVEIVLTVVLLSGAALMMELPEPL